jgi:hypothetical protein
MGAQPWAHHIVLGGAFALKQYLDYREPNDCDAWWNEGTTPPQRAAILDEIAAVLARLNPGLDLRQRSWGETASLELVRGSQKVFSFQISERTTRLSDYLASPFGSVCIESLEDNIGSKMSALTERGAPRDFLDIYRVAHDLDWSREKLWEVWRRKNRRQVEDEARLLARTYLERIVARRPLDRLPPAQREQTERVRSWFFDYFLK